jgi:gamma-glutamylcyclotransferase (GGCT)/AIG2-like uncharacterized protein YtfP
MFVRLVLWDLDGSGTTIEGLRAYLRDGAARGETVPGLRLKLWISEETTNRWGAVYLWESRAAADRELPTWARALIGKDPDDCQEFELEASAEGIFETFELAPRGIALGEPPELKQEPEPRPEPCLPLFVYGTLKSDEVARGVLEPFVERRAPAAARGHRPDTGRLFPAVIFDDAGKEIDGELAWIRPEAFADAMKVLDDYEGVPGLFERVKITVSADGDEVEAYAYQWRE